MAGYLEYQNLLWNPNLHICHRYLFLCRWCSRFRGRRRPPLPRGVAVPPPRRDRGSLRGASAPTSPAPAQPRRPLPNAPKAELRAGIRGEEGKNPASQPAAPQPRPRRPSGSAAANTSLAWSSAPAPSTARSGHPKNGINELGVLEAASPLAERGAPRRGRVGVRGGLGAPGPSRAGGDAAERGRRLPGARLHAQRRGGGRSRRRRRRRRRAGRQGA